MLGRVAMAMVSMVSAMLTTMESARLKQSLRLRLTLPYFTAPMTMVLVTMAMLGWDTMDIPMPTTDLLTTESVPLMLSLRPRLMLIPT